MREVAFSEKNKKSGNDPKTLGHGGNSEPGSKKTGRTLYAQNTFRGGEGKGTWITTLLVV